ncbi:endonuclease/exonuclease/phosphatase family protein [Kineococcus esterisolvens]|uniref:endonuclease/exonuclease/phosphatase family protein n=1 Tax=unclassified Kineococcus TaxID=2621656 RepID=UPI003D7E444C
MRVASVNAASGRDLATGRVDTDRLAAAVAALGADVVAVQEVDSLLPRSGGADQTAVLARACGVRRDGARFAAAVHGTPGAPGSFRPAAATVPGEPSYGVALLSRLPVLEWRELRVAAGSARLPLVLPPGAGRRLRLVPDEPRAVVAAVVDARAPGAGGGSRPVSVLGTHLSFSPLRAVAQLRELRRWAQDLPRPLVLLGDLNLPPGVVGRVLPWRPLVAGPTFPAPAPRVQLDHALADGLAPDARTAGRVERVGGSDHRAVVVDLDL